MGFPLKILMYFYFYLSLTSRIYNDSIKNLPGFIINITELMPKDIYFKFYSVSNRKNRRNCVKEG